MYINYTKIANASNSSLWQYKGTSATIGNLTIPQDCWDYNESYLMFKAYSSDAVGEEKWACGNGSDSWRILRDVVGGQICEEGIWWANATEASNPCDCPTLNTNWEIDFSDSCDLSTNCNLGTGDLTFTGAGNFYCNGTLDVASFGDLAAGQTIWVQESCSINIV